MRTRIGIGVSVAVMLACVLWVPSVAADTAIRVECVAPGDNDLFVLDPQVFSLPAENDAFASYRSLCLAVQGHPRVAPGSGDVIYTYTSLPFFFVAGDYTGVVPALYPNPVIDDGTADRITGSFVLSGSFVGEPVGGDQSITAGVVSYSFSDGHQTLTEKNSTATFGFSWGPSGPLVWDGTLTAGDSRVRLDWSIQITSATGEIVSFGRNNGSNLFERASHDGTAPFCSGAGYDVDHGGTNGGTSCLGGVADIGVNTSLLPSWTWTAKRVH